MEVILTMEKRCNDAIICELTKLSNNDAIHKNRSIDLVISLDEMRIKKRRTQFTAQYVAFYGTGWAK